MDAKDFKVGQTVYVELTGNAKRGRNKEELIEEWEVVKVGRKYIHAKRKESNYPVIFEKNHGYDERFVEKTDTCVDYILYASKTELEEKFEREKIYSEIRDTFREYGNPSKLSLEQLRKIQAIISESEG